MSISRGDLSVVAVGDVFEMDLRIPNYQRPYRWEPKHALRLLDDVVEASKGSPSGQYALGSLVLHKEPGSAHFDVVDGQQRLLTLHMLRALLQGRRIDFGAADARARVVAVHEALRTRIAEFTDSAGLSDYLDRQCVLVRVVTNDKDEAFRFFDSQNHRGLPLKPHDLLKSYHLREMRTESESARTAIVESWEAAGDARLEELFAKYLYRIARWSRNRDARGFSARNIDLFKGITPSPRTSPAGVYHYAAQQAVPLLTDWFRQRDSGGALSERVSQHSRFQLDAPVVAGKPFFEMVAFMLGEVDRLRAECFGGSDGAIPANYKDDSRYRYFAELFLCAALYFENKFAIDDQDVDRVRNRLFVWAYALRLDYLRVTWVTVNNYALRGDTSNHGKLNPLWLFPTMRNTVNGSDILRMSFRMPDQCRDPQDEQLRQLMLTKSGKVPG